MRRLNSQFKTRFISEPGSEGLNSTYYGFVEMDQYFCMAVAEGYDGEGGKDSAKLAVDTAIEAFIQKPGISANKLRSCIKRADKALAEQSVRIRLKAGLLLLVSDYTRFRYGVCGNVMLYAMRNSNIYHQSVTHTVYQSLAEDHPGETEALKNETRNLYHYLGGDGKSTVSKKLKLADGDVLLAATESFWSKVSRVEVLDAFESLKSEEEFLGDLQELYLRGSTEYVNSFCMAAVQIEKAYKENTKRKKKIITWVLVIAIIAAVAVILCSFYISRKRHKQQEIRSTVALYEDNGDRYLEEVSCVLAKQEYEKALESGKKLSKNEERLEKEQILSDKINLSTVLDNASKAYEARQFTQARTEYKRVLEYIKRQPDLLVLTDIVNQRLKQITSRMEIDNYMESAALKEAEGDLEAAGILYDRAEAMLRIVDDPELLKQAQLAKLRLKGQSEETRKTEEAKKRDQVIIDADQTAAMDAVLAGDYETALELYTKIRDSYIALEENDKAEETTGILLNLQKQARAAAAMNEEAIEENKKEALAAVLEGDFETALSLYEKIQFTYLAMGDQEKADEVQTLMDSVKQQALKGDAMKPEDSGKTGPGENGEKSSPQGADPEGKKKKGDIGPGVTAPFVEDPVGELLQRAKQAEADGDIEKAIDLYKQLRQVYKDQGNPELTGQMEEIISGLSEEKSQAQAAGPGGSTDG